MTSSSLNGNLSNLRHHPQYYHTGGDLIVIIGDTSFCVASYFFTRESPIFRERLEANDAGAGNANGLEAKQTIVIQPNEGVTADDFEKLCWVFYNGTFGVYDTSLETWKVVLRLATQYKFSEVKNLAFRELNTPGKFNISLVERIVLYRQFEAKKEDLDPLYKDLLSRPEHLSLEEGHALGMTLVLLVSKARERLRAACEKLLHTTPLPESMEKQLNGMVRTIPWNGSPDLSSPNGASGSTNGQSSPPQNTQPGTSTSTTNGH